MHREFGVKAVFLFGPIEIGVPNAGFYEYEYVANEQLPPAAPECNFILLVLFAISKVQMSARGQTSPTEQQ